MNLILFDRAELGRELPYGDARAVHISRILKLDEGDEFLAGVIGGPRGRARLLLRGAEGWRISFTALEESPALYPLTLVLGCPRPPTARRILKDMCAMGLKELRVCSTDLNEKSYLGARFWREGLWRAALTDGAMQGGTTLLPRLIRGASLERVLEAEGLAGGERVRRIVLDCDSGARRIVLDCDSGARRIVLDCDSQARLPGPCTADTESDTQNAAAGDRDSDAENDAAGDADEAVLAVGPERGWSDRERAVLLERGFTPLRLGERILRTETACAAGAALLLQQLGLY